jgi:hypothetical protein
MRAVGPSPSPRGENAPEVRGSPRRDSLTPQERTLRGRLGAYLLHARRDPRETTAAARAAFDRRFLDEVDPDRRLPEAERVRRAAAARKAHFTRLSYLAARRRRERKSR